MNLFPRLKIGTKLALVFGFMFLMVSAMASVSLLQLGAIDKTWQHVEHAILQKRNIASEAHFLMGDVVHHVKNYVIRGGDYDKRAEEALQLLEKQAEEYSKLGAQTAVETTALAGIKESVAAFRGGVEILRQGRKDNTSAEDLDDVVRGIDEPLSKAIDALVDFASSEAEKAAIELDGHVQGARTSLGVSVAVILVFVTVVAWTFSRALTSPMKSAVHLTQKVAAGDLTERIPVTTEDETGTLLKGLNDMSASLTEIVSEVRSGMESIATASQQIAAGTTDLSQRTESQATGLEETAAAMEELTGTVRQNAENASQASQLATAASEVAARGGREVGNVVSTMATITESSKKVGEIIGVIDAIAFQTNILALNAAVEAARAGEQGRGFAVVASEVRSLAKRSAEAAKEIKTLIAASTQEVQKGTKLVDDAGRTMQDIVTAIKRVNDLMGEIAAASQEQSTGIQQVSQTIVQMDETTQRNAALVEESVNATASLNDQAQRVTELLARFKVQV